MTMSCLSCTSNGVEPGDVILAISATWGVGSKAGLKKRWSASWSVADILRIAAHFALKPLLYSIIWEKYQYNIEQ